MSKYDKKVPIYKAGDILMYTNPLTKDKFTAILLRRYDLLERQRISWWYKSYPDGVEEFGAPEEEFSFIENIK